VAMSTSKGHRRKPPGILTQYCVFAALLPVYIPVLVLFALWTFITRKPVET
jgi:hypothetical protein